jgi:hypothetical protein
VCCGYLEVQVKTRPPAEWDVTVELLPAIAIPCEMALAAVCPAGPLTTLLLPHRITVPVRLRAVRSSLPIGIRFIPNRTLIMTNLNTKGMCRGSHASVQMLQPLFNLQPLLCPFQCLEVYAQPVANRVCTPMNDLNLAPKWIAVTRATRTLTPSARRPASRPRQ